MTFWVYSAADGYSDLAFRYRSAGTAGVTVNTLPLAGQLGGTGAEGWSTGSYRVYLSAGINKVVVRGARGEAVLDKLTVTPAPQRPALAANAVTYQAEDGTLAGTARSTTATARPTAVSSRASATGQPTRSPWPCTRRWAAATG